MVRGKNKEITKIIRGVKEFKEKSKKEFGIYKIIIFGSVARGKISEHGDIDLVLVSKKFSKKRFFDRSTGLRKFWRLDYPVDFLCYSPEEFEREKNRVSIINEALREGIEV